MIFMSNNFFKAMGFTSLLFLSSISVNGQTIKDLWNTVKSNTNSGGSGSSLGNLSNTEIVSGLKEALQVGAKNASGRLSVENGFFGNALIKILLPPEARKVEAALRNIGMGQLVDKTILSMNRAAEDAAGKAVPVFVNAITSMSIQDGLNILRGGNGAATNYLRNTTTAALTTAFRPVIQSSLNKLNVGTYWNQVFSTYNRLPLTGSKVNPDLTAYVTERALAGLFQTIAEEENKIRTNPGARVSDLLKKVFGAK
jgi:hypothetical protein